MKPVVLVGMDGVQTPVFNDNVLLRREMDAFGDIVVGDSAASPAEKVAIVPRTSSVRLSVRPALMAELGWTLAAVLLASTAGGVILLVVCLTGGSVYIDDFQQYFLPGYLDMNRALREGSFPLLSLSSWFGGNLAGEYQYGVFSIAHLLIVLFVFQLGLSLSGTATTLIAIYTAILSSGAFRLGRRLGLTVPNAMIMCLAAALNGWVFYWAARTWFSGMTGCAWIPWAWWGLELSLDRRLGSWRFVPGGILLYLLLTGGWPYAILMIGLVTVWLCFRNWRLFLTGRIWPIFAAWTLGFALASPAILALLEYNQYTERAGQNNLTDRDPGWRVPLAAFGGTILPQMPARWSAFGNPGLRNSCELFCGLAPCVALLVALVRWRMYFIREYRWELGLLVIVAILCHCGTLGPFRWAFRWLPLLHLLLGLLGGFALQRWSTAWKPTMPKQAWMRWFAHPDFRLDAIAARQGLFLKRLTPLLEKSAVWFGSLGAWSCLFVAVMTAYAWAVSSLQWCVPLMGLVLFALSLAWLFGDRRLSADSPVRAWIPVAVTVLALIVGNYRSAHSVKVWQLSDSVCESGPFDKTRTYLAMLTHQDVFESEDLGEDIGRCGNTSMYSGVSFVNGYSPMAFLPYVKFLGLQWCGYTTLPQGEALLKNHAAAGHLLSQMGVDGLVLGPGFTKHAELVKQLGWNPVEQIPLGTVFHRPGPPIPRVRSLTDVVSVNSDNEEQVIESSLARATIREVAETRLSVRCQVENLDLRRCAMIAFSRAYYPGYRAYLNGEEVPVETLSLLQPIVRIAPGAKGELAIVFAPDSVNLGIMIAWRSLFVTVAFLTTHALFRRRKLLKDNLP